MHSTPSGSAGAASSVTSWSQRSRPGRLVAALAVVAGLALGVLGATTSGHQVGPSQAHGGTWSSTYSGGSTATTVTAVTTVTPDTTITSDLWSGWGDWGGSGGSGTTGGGGVGGGSTGSGGVISAAGSTWS